MKLFSNLLLALLLLFLTDIAGFDYRLRTSKMLTEGTCPKKKCNLQKFTSGKEEESAKKSAFPINLSSCTIREKPCGKEKNVCGQKESTECPLCGQDLCSQQQKSNCPPQKNKCPQQKSNCPQTKTKCPSATQPKCPQAPKPKCPPPSKPSCHQEKPVCPERCSMFRKFAFPAATSIKYSATTTSCADHKNGKCPPSCTGGVVCKNKPVK